MGGIGRTRDAEARVSIRDRELEAVANISNTLARARTPVDAARPLVRQVTALLGVGFAGVVVVDDEADGATGIYAELNGVAAAWWEEVQVDLRNEPSGIASAVFDAAPVTVYDIGSSSRISPRLAAMVGAQSGAWVPMLAEERVIGVLVFASTDRKRTFAADELAVLQAIASEAALALERLRSEAALSDALAREQLTAQVVRRIRAQLDPGAVLAVAREELARALDLSTVSITIEEGAHVACERELAPGERFFVDTVEREVDAALHTAGLLAENERRLDQQAALLHAAQVVTSELEIEAVLERLVQEVTKLLNADAADCHLVDADRGVLRCAAVHGFGDAPLLGSEFSPPEGLAGAPVPSPAYDGFARALVAPMVWAGETRGVLGVGVRDPARTFSEADVELLEAFASLASLALRNAESFGEWSRQARVQRGFYRIASLLGEPLSLAETYDAAAQAAAEALGGEFSAALVRSPAGLGLVGGHALPEAVRSLELPRALDAAALEGHLLAASRISDDDRFDERWRDAPFAALLAIPVGGETPGLVLVFFVEERDFARDDLELAHQVAAAATGALDRSRLFEAERTARSLSQQLARTGSLLATELDPGAVLEAVVSEAVNLLDADAAALAALEGEELVITAASGDGAEQALGARSPATGWVAGDVAQSRAPVAHEDTASNEGLAESDALLSLGHRAYLGVPLTGRDGALVGVLSVYSLQPRLWREDETQALAALAANGSIALSNAELYQHVAVEREQSVAILANIADGIVAVDRDGNVVLWNRAAEEITGVPAAEAVGRTPAQVLQRDLRSVRAGTSREIAIVNGDREVWLSLSEAVMRDPTGAVAGRIFAFRDISTEHVVEQMQSDFVSTASLELRAPLTTIYGFAQTLLREDITFGEAERRTFHGVHLERGEAADDDRGCAARRGKARRGRARRFARGHRRRVGGDRRRGRGGVICERASGRRRRRPRAVAAQADRASSGRCSISLFRTRSSTRRAAAWSACRCSGTLTRSRLRSQTRAWGFPPPNASGSSRSSTRRAVDRAPASGSSSPRGSCARWAAASGSIRKKGGVDVRLRAPRGEGRDGVSFAERGITSRMSIRVLVIDDESPIRLLCRINLEAEGMEVLEAADGLSGLDVARLECPDVILLDVMMPGLDGWRVAEELLDDDRTEEIPIVFLTARAELRDRARGIDLGGVDYITKPFNPVELAPLVRDLLVRVERGERDELRREKLSELRLQLDRDQLTSACRLREQDRRQDDRRTGELDASEALGEPGPADERADDGLEHRHDPDRRRAQMTECADEQEERGDRSERDHPAGQQPHRQVRACRFPPSEVLSVSR